MVAGWTSGPLIVFAFATNPFIWVLNHSANGVLKLFRTRAPSEMDRLHSPEEIRMLVEQGRRAGTIEKSDARLLAGVFEFSEKNAREVMTPRTQMIALHETDSLAEAADRIAAAGRSRYPVYRESLDDIAGIVHAKDVLAALRAAEPRPLSALCRPAHFVPGSREVEDVLADMKSRKVHMVIVLDEFGGTAGLVTNGGSAGGDRGQIEDEYDRPSKPGAPQLPQPAGSTIYPGSADLSEVADKQRIQIESDDYTTLGGYLFGKLGRLPRVGDRVDVPGGVFEVTAMEGRRVAEARFTKKS